VHTWCLIWYFYASYLVFSPTKRAVRYFVALEVDKLVKSQLMNVESCLYKIAYFLSEKK